MTILAKRASSCSDCTLDWCQGCMAALAAKKHIACQSPASAISAAADAVHKLLLHSLPTLPQGAGGYTQLWFSLSRTCTAQG